MTRAKLLVFSSPVSAEAAEAFDEWYDRTHIPQVVANVAGIVSGERLIRSDIVPDSVDAPAFRRLTIYEVDPDDVADTIAALFAAMSDGTIEQSPLIDRTERPVEVSVYVAE